MFHLTSTFWVFYTSGQSLHLTSQLLYIANNKRQNYSKAKEKTFQMNKESICASFSLCLSSEYLGDSSYAPIKMPQTACFAKRKAWTTAFCSYWRVEFKHCLWPLLWIFWSTNISKMNPVTWTRD